MKSLKSVSTCTEYYNFHYTNTISYFAIILFLDAS